MYIRFRLLTLLFSLTSFSVFGQTSWENLFSKLEIHLDTLIFTSVGSMVDYNNERCLYFIYNDENAIAEIALYPLNSQQNDTIALLPAGDYYLMDSLQFYNNAWRCKIGFRNLTRSQFLKLQVKITGAEGQKMAIIRLLPCTHTTISMKPNVDELFIGEEKVFDLVTNRADNIRYSMDWTSGQPIDYRIEKVGDQFRLHVIPNVLGYNKIKLNFQTEKPWVDMNTNRISTQTAPVEYTFDVKNTQL